MENTKLLRLYSILSKHELVQLGKVVYSPALNKHQDVNNLYEFIRANKATPEKITKPRVFEAVFPHQQYDDLKLRHVCSYLLKVIENMLTGNELAKDSEGGKVQLFRAYKQKELTNETEKLSSKLQHYFATTTAPNPRRRSKAPTPRS